MSYDYRNNANLVLQVHGPRRVRNQPVNQRGSRTKFLIPFGDRARTTRAPVEKVEQKKEEERKSKNVEFCWSMTACSLFRNVQQNEVKLYLTNWKALSTNPSETRRAYESLLNF